MGNVECQKILTEIALQTLGTPNYKEVLDVLSPSSQLVKEFKKQVQAKIDPKELKEEWI